MNCNLWNTDKTLLDKPEYAMDKTQAGLDHSSLREDGTAEVPPTLVGKWLERGRMQIRKSFFPHGYPHSVGEGYAQYVSWIACGSLFSSAAGGELLVSFFLFF